MKTILKVSLVLSLLLSSVVTAHPGRTASDGCHYCRTNCGSWGVPEGQRHCHGGYMKPDVLLDQSEVNKVSLGGVKHHHDSFKHSHVMEKDKAKPKVGSKSL